MPAVFRPWLTANARESRASHSTTGKARSSVRSSSKRRNRSRQRRFLLPSLHPKSQMQLLQKRMCSSLLCHRQLQRKHHPLWSSAAGPSRWLSQTTPHRSFSSGRSASFEMCFHHANPGAHGRPYLSGLRPYGHAQVHRRARGAGRIAVPSGSAPAGALPLLWPPQRPYQGAALGRDGLPAALQASGRWQVPVAR